MFNPNVVVKIVTQPRVENIVTLIARILMAYIFCHYRLGQVNRLRLCRNRSIYGINGRACRNVTIHIAINQPMLSALHAQPASAEHTL